MTENLEEKAYENECGKCKHKLELEEVKNAKMVKKVTFAEDNNEEDIEEPTQVTQNDKRNKFIKKMLCPVEPTVFFENTWETRPLHIIRKDTNFYDFILSTSQIGPTISENELIFSEDVKIIEKENKTSECEDESKFVFQKVTPDKMSHLYKENYSQIIKNSEKYFKKIHRVVSELQEHFGTRIITKIIISPPRNEITGPRSDNTDTFVFQIEGISKWKLYFPSDNAMLSRRKKIYKKDELEYLLMDMEVSFGDFFYFPNGIPYEIVTKDEKSIMLILSITKNISWGDYLFKLLPMALKQATNEDVAFRKSLPLHYLSFTGVYSKESENKSQFFVYLNNCLEKLMHEPPIDHAVDQLAKTNIMTYVPPWFSKKEIQKSVFSVVDLELDPDKKAKLCIKIDTKMKIIRPKIFRLVFQENEYRIYHSTPNKFGNTKPHFFKIGHDLAPGVEALVKNYPRYLKIDDLPLQNDNQKIKISTLLWKNGLVMIKN